MGYISFYEFPCIFVIVAAGRGGGGETIFIEQLPSPADAGDADASALFALVQ